MANRAVKIFGAVIGIAVVGAGAGWYVLSGQVVTSTTHFFESLSKANAQGKPGIQMTWEHVERLPFPAIGVRLRNSKMEIPAFPEPSGATAPTTTLQMANTIDVVTDYAGRQYRLSAKQTGPFIITQGTETKNFPVTSDEPMKITVKARDLSSFMAWNSLNMKDDAAVKKAFKDIQFVQMIVPAFTVTNATNNATAAKLERMEIAFMNRSSDAFIEGDLLMDIKGSEITPEYDALLNAFVPVPSTMPLKYGDMPFSHERAGKQDIQFDVGFKFPNSSLQGPEKSPPKSGMMDLRKAYTKNNFFTMSTPLRVELKDDPALVSMKLDWSLEATQAGAAEMSRVIDFAGKLLIPPAPPAGTAPASPSPEAIKQKILTALPTLSTLGPVTLALDMEMTGPKGAESITLRNFALNHKRWGLEAKGSATKSTATGPKVDMTILCKKCEYMTWDMVAAGIQAQDAANTMKQGSANWGITPQTMANLNTFLAHIGKKDPATGNIAIAITTPTAGDIRINDKPFGEAMMLAITLFAPPAAQAPAVGSVKPH